MFKKIIIALILMISILSLTSCDAGFEKVSLDDFDYETINGVDILKKYIGDEKKIKVSDGAAFDASTFAGNELIEEVVLNFTSIPMYAFENCTNLKKVKLRSVNYISPYAFKGCENLKEVEIEYTVDYVSPEAFLDCHKLEKIEIFGGSFPYSDAKKKNLIYGNSIVIGTDVIKAGPTIGEYAFYGRDAIASLTIPTNITKIEKYAFGNCQNLTRIRVDSGNTTFDSRDNCNAVIETNTDKLVLGCQNTIIPNDVQVIGAYAFADCKYLNGVNIPTGVKTIEDNAFIGCTGLQTINVSANNYIFDSRDNCNAIILTAEDKLLVASNSTIIPSSVKTIAPYAFSNVNAANIIIPEGVETIEANAFANMPNLTSVTIPSTVTSIDKNAFSGCNNLMQIIVNGANTIYDSRSNANAVIETATNKLIVACNGSTIPNTVEKIGEEAFANCNNLTAVTIPSSVKTIEKRAFADCKNLVGITLLEGVKTIEDGAFMNCSNVSILTLPNSLTTIGNEAFANMKTMDTLKIPSGVSSIGEKAFAGWEALINIIVDEANETYTSLLSSAIIEKASKTLVTGCAYTVLDDSVSKIKAYAFYGSKIKRIAIPSTVVEIETAAFANCPYLVQITVDSANSVYEDRGLNAIVEKETSIMITGCASSSFDKSIVTIGAHAFEGNAIGYLNLNLSANKNITKIEEYAFANCPYLNYIDIAKNVSVIESHAFANSQSAYIYFNWRMSVPDTFAEDWNSTSCRTNIS